MATLYGEFGPDDIAALIDSLSDNQKRAEGNPGLVARGPTGISYNPSPRGSGPVIGGTGFTFDSAGNPTGGTVTSVIQNGDTGVGYGINGISVPVTQLYAASAQGQGAALLASLLTGDDTFDIAVASGSTAYQGFGGNDRFNLERGAGTFDGGPGVNSSHLFNNRSDCTVQITPSAVQIAANPMSFPGITGTFISVQEFSFADGILSFDPATQGGTAYALYKALLGRAPDTASQGYWAETAQSASAHDLAGGLLGSAEAQARLGGLDDAGFVSALYGNLLGRATDAGGLSYWTGLLASGTSRADLALGFVGTDEARQSLAPAFAQGVFGADPNAVAVDRVYLAATGKLPTSLSLSGGTLFGLETFLAEDLTSGFGPGTGSNLSLPDAINRIIENAYGGPDPGAQAYYLGQIQAGHGTLANVIDAYAFSPGIDARVAPYVTNNGVQHA